MNKVRLTKKELIESIKINEDDYNYIVMNVIPEIDDTFTSLIKRYFNFTKEELLDTSNLTVCYKYYVSKYNPVDFRKNLNNLNIVNPIVRDIIYYNKLDIHGLFSMICNLNDAELYYVLQNFLVKFYDLLVYLTAKQIKIDNLNEEYFKSWYLDEEFVFFVHFMVDHGYYELSIKRLDFISDINRFFKIKNLDLINTSKVRGRDDVLTIIVSKMFSAIFYKVLFELNIRNKFEQSNYSTDTYDVIYELYQYFYRRIFVGSDHELEGIVPPEIVDFYPDDLEV